MSIEAPQGTQAVIRAIGLLKSFTSEQPEMSLAQLSEAMGLKRATAHRLLAALESEDLLTRNPHTGHYMLGPAVIALGSQALLTSDLRASVRPILEELANLCGETATLEILTGDQMLIIDGIQGQHRVSASLDLGTHWPVHLTSTGKALLAEMSEVERARYLKVQLSARTKKSITDAKVLEKDLILAARRGYALASEELEDDYVAISAAFRGALGQLEGAICVGGPRSRFTAKRQKELGALIRDMAQRLSNRHKRF